MAGKVDDRNKPAAAGGETPGKASGGRGSGTESEAAVIERVRLRLREEQKFSAALLAGAVAAFMGAVIWAGVTALTRRQMGWMAAGVGLLVAYSVRSFGRGLEPRFRVLAAAMALAACLLGNLLTVCAIVAATEGIPFLQLLARLDVTTIAGLMTAYFQPIDLFFYALALFMGWRLSLRHVRLEDLAGLADG